ncbi:bifunctional 4-hydroxy-2-oxoglutarate aldolase/2-dehydro-3-deoxy-phosphogluconate aldolase [Terrabacter sp. GCM10028922]|uniref:bifunctional 4-hydroxy-2-oxoglutarate aldolase/2-dehydro-3-deoxy-phosphogluconate aldolase n=1 Tax=Terrabacter sp. GCM10028922 TaxID=3273428 RepID=UPI00361B73F5
MSSHDLAASADAFVDQVSRAKIIPVLRTRTAREAVTAASRCFDAGLTMVELTATTPDWPQALRQVRADHPRHLVGVGTVLDADQARIALEAGADFIVSPCPAPAVRAALASRVPFMEGGLSVGEVLASATHGVAKLFPAHVGGIDYLRSLLAIAPGAHVVPTGGVALTDVAGWLAAGATAVGVGRDLVEAEDMVSAIREALDGP